MLISIIPVLVLIIGLVVYSRRPMPRWSKWAGWPSGAAGRMERGEEEREAAGKAVRVL